MKMTTAVMWDVIIRSGKLMSREELNMYLTVSINVCDKLLEKKIRKLLEDIVD